MTRTPRIAAFTLVELLVVVAIIALLLSILLPSLNKARDLARMTACLSNARQLGLANVAYASEHEDTVIPGSWGDSAGKGWTYHMGLLPYLGKALDSNDVGKFGIRWGERNGYALKVFKCPGDPQLRDRLVGDAQKDGFAGHSYAMNVAGAYGGPNNVNPDTGKQNVWYHRIGRGPSSYKLNSYDPSPTEVPTKKLSGIEDSSGTFLMGELSGEGNSVGYIFGANAVHSPYKQLYRYVEHEGYHPDGKLSYVYTDAHAANNRPYATDGDGNEDYEGLGDAEVRPKGPWTAELD
jgi:prepilin-type N-terminal cleavage/methylation domain-containing protein